MTIVDFSIYLRWRFPDSSSVSFTIAELTFINWAGFPYILATTLKLIFSIISSVNVTIFEVFHSYAWFLAIFELAFINPTTFKFVDSVPMLLITHPLALVNITVFLECLSISLFFIIYKIPNVNGTVLLIILLQNALTISFAILEFSSEKVLFGWVFDSFASFLSISMGIIFPSSEIYFTIEMINDVMFAVHAKIQTILIFFKSYVLNFSILINKNFKKFLSKLKVL